MITGTRNMQLNIILSIFALTLIPACYGVEAECKTTTKGREYTGILSVTEHGLQCQRWDAKTPHHPVPSIIAISNFPPGTGTLDKAENYCRNPDSDARPWCYTMDPKVKYQFCDIPFCPETTTPKSTTTSTTQSPTTPPAKGECVCRGDPHCYQFDADRSNPDEELYITNVCDHLLATDFCSWSSSTTFFYVHANFDRVKDNASTKTFVKQVMLSGEEGMDKITIGQGMTVTDYKTGSLIEVPSTDSGYIIKYVAPTFTDPKDFPLGTTQVLSATFKTNGVEVQYDGVKSVKIIYPPGMTGNCGLCGNNDGVLDENDLLKGFNTNRCNNAYPFPGTEFTLANNEADFVNSWFFKSTDDEACQEVCPSAR